MIASRRFTAVLAKVGPVQAAVPRFLSQTLISGSLLEAVLPAGAGLYVLTFIAAAAARLFFAYPIETGEGASLEAVRGILRGEPLYSQPTLEHVPQIYGPLYFYAAAAVSLVIGPGFAALRLTSLVASFGSLLLTYLLVKRETGSAAAGVLAAGVFAACYPLAGGALDLGRVDALLVCLMLGAVYASRSTGFPAAVVAGVCIGLALLTKQAAAPIALVLIAYFALVERWRLVGYLAGLLVSVSVSLVVLELQSGHLATLFLVLLPLQHGALEQRLGLFWRTDVLPRYTIALVLGGLFIFARLMDGMRRTALFYALVGTAMLATAWASESNAGAFANVLLPAYAVLAIVFALGLHEMLRQLRHLPDASRHFWGFGVGIGILQLVLLIYQPRAMVPYRSDGWADERLAARLASLPGQVFAPDYDAYLLGSGRPEQPYSGALAELLGGYGGTLVPEGEGVMQTLSARLARREYDRVVLDPESQFFFFSGALREAGYVDSGPLFDADDEIWLWRTGVTPKAELYVPAERIASSGRH